MAVDAICTSAAFPIKALFHRGRFLFVGGLHGHTFIIVDVVLSSRHFLDYRTANDRVAYEEKINVEKFKENKTWRQRSKYSPFLWFLFRRMNVTEYLISDKEVSEQTRLSLSEVEWLIYKL